MKKIKFYKSALSLLTATSMLLMSGCTGGKSEEVFIQSDVLMSGVTSQYNVYDVYHDIADEQLNIEPIQKIKK